RGSADGGRGRAADLKSQGDLLTGRSEPMVRRSDQLRMPRRRRDRQSPALATPGDRGPGQEEPHRVPSADLGPTRRTRCDAAGREVGFRLRTGAATLIVYGDTSAFVKLVLHDSGLAELRTLRPQVTVLAAVRVAYAELRAAVAAAYREGRLTA